MNQSNPYKIFKHGAVWLKADFHLHTKADGEFNYPGEPDRFVSDYVGKLKKNGLHLGVITNHNKFDKNEFQALRKKAKKEEIYLLPGIELSINDGANGIHTLIVFSDEWLERGKDYISPFITSLFPGKTEAEYQTENGRSDKNILQTVEELEKTARDYFLIFAHVEQKSGLWEEMNGGKLGDFRQNRYHVVRKKTLGFQKVRTNDDRNQIQKWLHGWYPAEVEGSDCKSITEIGKCKPCWLKLGDFTFEAVKYALLDKDNRLDKKEPIAYSHSYIKNITFKGGVLDGRTVHFSPELNTLIGIRGSGKSSILEAVRYSLDIPFGENVMDDKYKIKLTSHTFGSGGKVSVKAIDRHGNEYEIRRILNELPEVFAEGTLQPGVSIRKTIIHKPIYFGQKDLSSTGDGFEKDLVEKLIGEKLIGIRGRIEEQKYAITELCKRLYDLSRVEEKKREYEQKKQDAEFRLKIFKDNGVQEKLKKQTNFDTDQRKLVQIISDVTDYKSALTDVINQYEDDLHNHMLYKPKQNNSFFQSFLELYQHLLNSFAKVKSELQQSEDVLQSLTSKQAEFENLRKQAADEFASMRRILNEELKNQGKSLNLDEFPNLQKAVETSEQMLNVLSKQQNQGTNVYKELIDALSDLHSLWHEEYQLITSELKKVNDNETSLKIVVDYKGDKTAFIRYFSKLFKGSRIRENSFQEIVNDYTDFTAIFKDIEAVKIKVGTLSTAFENYFSENLAELLTWQVPNQITITYRGKELQHHSLGQRASALILFVLSQQENDIVIIDQPEDDLDNQTIYEDLIKLIRQLKNKTQFIFATHNANFPVLGDAELIHSCKYADEKIALISGSIDAPVIQKEVVDIMEGGEAAFNKRKEIYQIWKPRNS